MMHRRVFFKKKPFSHFKVGFQTGLPGLNAASHVVQELNCVIDHAPIHDEETMEQNAWDLLMKHGQVPLNCAQQQVTVFKASHQNKLIVLYKLYC